MNIRASTYLINVKHGKGLRVLGDLALKVAEILVDLHEAAVLLWQLELDLSRAEEDGLQVDPAA